VTGHAPVGETCPLCGAPLHPEQEWCLRCGAAARTRLAASSNWKPPIIAVAVVAALSLGVLAAALVKLVWNSGSTASPATTTVTAPAAVTAATPAPSAPSATPPAATTPAARTRRAVVLAPVSALTSSTVTLNGEVNPQGVPTTYQFRYGTTARYGSTQAGPVPVGAGTGFGSVNSKLAYLTPGTTYHYELTASKAGRLIHTADATFTTPPAPPGARTTTPGKTGTSTSPATTPPRTRTG
jgi:hypothetical protein